MILSIPIHEHGIFLQTHTNINECKRKHRMVGLLIQRTPMEMSFWHYLPSKGCLCSLLPFSRLPDYYVNLSYAQC